jgi:hypothetical protein
VPIEQFDLWRKYERVGRLTSELLMVNGSREPPLDQSSLGRAPFNAPLKLFHTVGHVNRLQVRITLKPPAAADTVKIRCQAFGITITFSWSRWGVDGQAQSQSQEHECCSTA